MKKIELKKSFNNVFLGSVKRAYLPLLMLIVCSILGTTDAWAGGGGHSTHYGKVVAGKVTGSANGTVYVATSNTKPSAETTKATWNCGGSSGSDKKTCYWWADNSVNGYYFAGWYSAQNGSGTAAKTTANFSEEVTTSSTDKNYGTTTKAYYAKFSPVDISGGENVEFPANVDVKKEGIPVVFTSEHADAGNDFSATISGATLGVFSTPTIDVNTASREVTVNYDYTANSIGTEHATLTIQSVGGENHTSVEITVNNTELSNFDTEVRKSDGTLATTTGSYTFDEGRTNWTTALAYANANAGCTIKLLRDVNLGALAAHQAVSKTMTFDLNGYKLEATATSDKRIMNISGASTVVTIEDNAGGGKIVSTGNFNGTYYGIVVGAGKLVLNSGEIEVTNEKVYASGVTSMAVRGIHISAGANFTMNGGTLTTEGGNYVYAIYQANSATTNGEVHINNGTINAGCWRQYAYGLYGLGKMYVDGGSINAKTYTSTGSSEAYGIYVGSSANQTASAEYMGELFMTAGTVNAISQTSGAYGVGVLGGTTPGTKYTDDGTYYLTANRRAYPAQATISGGTFNATSTTSGAYGLYVMGSVRSVSDEYDHSMDKPTVVTGGTFNATATTSGAYGIMANAESSWAYACLRYGIVEVSNAMCNAKTGTSGAYGAYVNVSSKRWAEGAASTSWNASYPFRDRKDEYTVAAKMTIHSGTFTGTASTTSGYGVCSATRAIALSGDYENTAYPELVINDGTFIGKTAGSGATTTAYGLYSGGNTTVNGGTFTGIPNTTTGGGAYVNAGKTIINGGTFTTPVTTNAYGVYVNAAVADVTGVKTAGEVEINNAPYFNIASGGTETYGIYLKKADRTVAAGSEWNRHPGYYACAAEASIKGGYYVNAGGVASCTTLPYQLYPLGDYQPEYTQGYRFVVADERPLGTPVCKAIAGTTTTYFYTLENALTYAQENSGTTMTIIMLCDYTLPAGYYTVPSNVSLVVPYKDSQTAVLTTSGKASHNQTYTTPSLFRKLTLDEGAHLEVFGVLETSCQMFNNSQGNKGNGNPTGPYGQIDMAEGSTITMVSGSKLYAWGYITGKGMVDARRGSSVYEMFQVYDWKGGSASKDMNNNSEKIFLVNQYYIQNIEVPIKFHPGSHEYTSFGVVMSSTEASSDNIGIIGLRNKKDGTEDDVAMFLMDEYDDSDDTWVMKDYDEVNDRQIYSINSAAKLSSIDISVKVTLISVKMNSANYILPITNNMSIHLLSGAMGITQDVVLLPGAEIEVDKEATASIDANKTLYLYDSDQWGPYAYSSGYSNPVLYSPSWKKCPRVTSSAAALGDAKLNIHGTLEVNGTLRTTASGANIFSSVDDAGTIIFKAAAPNAAVNLWQMEGTATKRSCEAIPALLTNENSTYPTTATSGTAAGKSFCYLDVDGNGGKWTSLTTDRCFAVDEANDIIYAKPGAYVAITSKTEDANHLYHSVDGDRLFIVIHGTNHIGCQWWEVEQTEEDDAVYYCADNDTYYIYDGAKWAVKKIEVTWTNFDGTRIETYNVPFGSKPKYLGTNPKRANDTYYTYSFVGWLPEITEDTKVFENTTYVAQYERHDRLFAITFKDGTTTIETDYYSWGSMPVCEKEPTKAGYILSWSPALGAVSGNQTYTAVWTAETVDPTTLTYTVTWKNYNGTTLETDNDVAYGVLPSYDGATPTKAAIKDIAFEHDGWTPDVEPVTANVVYTAKFREVAAKYTVTFLAQDGSTVIESQQVAYGEVPVCQNMPTQASNAEYYFVAKWNKEITAVTGDVTYTHDGFTAYKNTCRLTVAAGANGSVLLDGASDPLSAIYDYGTDVVISATADAHYHFVQWSDGNTENPRTIHVTETKSVTAQFAIDQVTITWLNYDGSTITTSEVDYGSTPAYSGATPNRPAGCGVFYTFNGWSPAFAAVTTATSYTAQYNEVSNPSLKSYQVAFAANGGTGTMTNQAFTYGAAQNLKANTFAYAPYTVTYVYANGDANSNANADVTFNGWSDGANSYTDQQSVNNLTDECDGVVTLTAQWSVASIILPTPEKTGYTFNGWFDAATDGNKIGDAGTSYRPSADITLYAQWRANQHTLTWDLNGGTVKTAGTAAGSVAFGTSLTAPTVEKTGYTFDHWEPAVPATMPDANAAYTAQWTPDYSTVWTMKGTFEDEWVTVYNFEKKVGEQAGSIAYVTVENLAADQAYWFKVWDASNNYGQTGDGYKMYYNNTNWTLNGTYNVGVQTTVEGDYQFKIDFSGTYPQVTVIYPDFEIVTFDLQGKGSNYEKYVTPNTAIAEPTAPIADGFVFGGWYENAECTGSAWDFSTTLSANKTLYAKWTAADSWNYLGEWDDNWALKPMTRGANGQYYYWYTYASDENRLFKIEKNSTYYGYQYNHPQFNGTDVEYMNTTGNDWGVIDNRCAVNYRNGRYYIIVYVPNTLANPTSDPIICASTSLPAEVVETGEYMDIVDWNTSGVVLNMNGITASTPVTAAVNGGAATALTEGTTYSYQGQADRTFAVNTGTLTPGNMLRLTVNYTSGSAYTSNRYYRIPYIYNSTQTVSKADYVAEDQIVIRSGKVTLSGNVTVDKVYVYPGAELNVTGSLTCNYLYVRTTAFEAGAVSGNIIVPAGQTYYTRIVADKTYYFQFALPFDCELPVSAGYNTVKTTAGNTYNLNKHFRLKHYDADNRAENGSGSSNWVNEGNTLTGNTIVAQQGYEFLSASAYYREYLFPVTYQNVTGSQVVAVTCPTGTAAEADSRNGGWNYFCSPFPYTYNQTETEDPYQAKFSWLNADNKTYTQGLMTEIKPGRPYLYQASAAGTLTYGSYVSFAAAAPSAVAARGLYEGEGFDTPVQLLVLNLTNAAELSDKTYIYLHPSRFSSDYEAGADLEKLKGYAERPQLYTRMACGDLAFNALPDSVAEIRIPLGTYAATTGEQVFSLQQNDFISRMEHIFLVDELLGTVTDLLSADYSYEAEQGTDDGRFYLVCAFRAPEVIDTPTDIDNNSTINNQVQKVYIGGHIYILRDGDVFDMTGRKTVIR